MSGNLLEMIHRYLDDATIDKMSQLLDESHRTTRSAVDQVTPVLVGGLAQKASSPEGSRKLLASLDRVEMEILDDVPGYLESNKSHVTQAGKGILSGLFGADLARMFEALGSSTGLGDAGAATVMKMTVPVVMAVLARHQRRERLDAVALSTFLDDQRRDVNAALPASLAGLFDTSPGTYGELGEAIGEDRERADRRGGVQGRGTGGAPVAEATDMHERHGGGGPSALYREQPTPEAGGPRLRTERPAGLRWLVPLIGVAAIIALAYGLLRQGRDDGRSSGEQSRLEQQTQITSPDPLGGEAAGEVGGDVGGEQGTEDEALHLGVLFRGESSELDLQPGHRLNELLQEMENNPEQRVEIRGYAFGNDEDEVERLGQERAEAVKAWLLDNGVDEERLTTTSGGVSAHSQVDVLFK